MTQGRSIRLFLVDGAPNGLLTAEIMNWTGHVLTGPRSKLPELLERPECARTGIYFLVGPDPENSMRPLVYIGESDDVASRLKQHNREEGKGLFGHQQGSEPDQGPREISGESAHGPGQACRSLRTG